MATTPETLAEKFNDVERRVARLERGATGGTIQTPEFIATLDITGLEVESTEIYPVGDRYQAYLDITWDPVPSDPNEIQKDPVVEYELHYSLDEGDTWSSGGTTRFPPLRTGPFAPGSDLIIRVRARTQKGVRGNWASIAHIVTTDINPPNQPSTPVVTSRLGQLVIVWDGKDVNGDDMPEDFRTAYVHVETGSPTFVPDADNFVGNFNGGTFVVPGLDYGEEYFVRLVAWDTTGNQSAPSTAASTTIKSLVDTDIIGEVISGANIVPDSIVASEKIVGESITGALIQSFAIESDKIAANAITTDKVQAGAIRAEHLAFGVVNSNMLLNPGAEDILDFSDSTDWAVHEGVPGWTFLEGINGVGIPHGVRFTETSASYAPHRGISFFVLNNDGTGQDGNRMLSDWHSIDTDKVYAVSLYARFRYSASGPSVGSRLRVTMEYSFDGGETVEGTNILFTENLTGSSWVDLDAPWEPPAGTTHARLRLHNMGPAVPDGNNATIMIDDIAMMPLNEGAVELTAAGIRMWDAEGSESVSLSSTGVSGNFASFGGGLASISDDGKIAATEMYADEAFYYKGDELQDVLDVLPRGIVAYGQFTNSTFSSHSLSGAGEITLFEMSFTPDSTRMYQIGMSPIILSIGSGSGNVDLAAFYTTDGSRPTTSSARLTIGSRAAGGTGYREMGFDPFILNPAEGNERYRILFAIISPGPAVFIPSSTSVRIRAFAIDIGASERVLGGNTVINRAGSSPSESPTVRYVKTYTATWAQAYLGNGSKYTTNVGKAYQGYTPYHPSGGNKRSMIGFPSMTGDLSGADIKKVEVYLYFEHWHYNSGGTAVIGTHGSTSAPSTFSGSTDIVRSGSWPKPGGRWVTLPSSTHSGFKSGSRRGIVLGPGPSNSSTYYGIARGAGSAKIRVTYEK